MASAIATVKYLGRVSHFAAGGPSALRRRRRESGHPPEVAEGLIADTTLRRRNVGGRGLLLRPQRTSRRAS